ncbi:ankyrin repeat protein [Colletotrichum kahawae]|uniref:Ankyrin repeat protein n=1 Tax=Colletotrichum kahawae TaxID=34407 RepID=A0AAD9YDB8_COLKA|nr:ankyrin repeat protein [Colletotrichum kahawae]
MPPAASSSGEEAGLVEVEDDTFDVNKTYGYEFARRLYDEDAFGPYKISIPHHPTIIDIHEDGISYIKMLGVDDEAKQFSRKWDQQLRPTGAVPRSILPNHAWIMEPSVDLDIDRGTGFLHGTIFFSYLNWEVYGAVKSRGGNSDAQWSPTRHQRKTLDQFYYSGLRDTGRRDRGQTVSKWTGGSGSMTENGRLEAVTDSLVVMVDQMWMWTSARERTHKMVLELLDLEQKAASLGEARTTTQQGRAVMLFTIITIIFNVSELTGDPQNPTSGQVWKIAAPISVVVILGSLGVAFFIMYPDSVKSCLRRKSTNKTAV